MNIQPKYEDVVAQLAHAKRQYQEMLDEAIALRRDRDALRETLENSYTAEDHERLVAKGQELNVKYIEKLEQRLTVAEQRAERMDELLITAKPLIPKGKFGSLTYQWHLEVSDALKPSEEGEGS